MSLEMRANRTGLLVYLKWTSLSLCIFSAFVTYSKHLPPAPQRIEFHQHFNVRERVETLWTLDTFDFNRLAAIIAFCAFQGVAGQSIVAKIIASGLEKRNSGMIENTEAECAGHVLDYAIRAMIAVVIAGFLIGTADANRQRLQQNLSRISYTLVRVALMFTV